MKNYICSVCGKPITSDGLMVKIKDSQDNILKVIPIHKGDCDNYLVAWGRETGFNTNASMEMSFFSSDDERTSYMGGSFSITDDDFYHKYFNDDGTLKRS